MIIEERASTHVYRQKRMFTKEELEAIEPLCVHEQPHWLRAEEGKTARAGNRRVPAAGGPSSSERLT